MAEVSPIDYQRYQCLMIKKKARKPEGSLALKSRQNDEINTISSTAVHPAVWRLTSGFLESHRPKAEWIGHHPARP